MNERRRYGNRKKKYHTNDRRKKQQEVQQIKKDLINYAKSSWGKRWIHSMLKIGRPYRMRRGILYAESEERISNLRINKGQIFSLVQGTAPTPYRIKINFEIIKDDEWQIIINKIRDNLLNIIDLLEGKLTEEILQIFETQNQSLFPDVKDGLNATCSCPDQAIPCKHIAATILYIARVVDFNPLILLKLKGKTKKDILKEIQSTYLEVENNELNHDELNKSDRKEIRQMHSFHVPEMKISNLLRDKKKQEKMPEIGFKIKKYKGKITTLENIGLPMNLENPKYFATILDKFYRLIMKKSYKNSISS